jgi:hypothetical protein
VAFRNDTYVRSDHHVIANANPGKVVKSSGPSEAPEY